MSSIDPDVPWRILNIPSGEYGYPSDVGCWYDENRIGLIFLINRLWCNNPKLDLVLAPGLQKSIFWKCWQGIITAQRLKNTATCESPTTVKKFLPTHFILTIRCRAIPSIFPKHGIWHRIILTKGKKNHTYEIYVWAPNKKADTMLQKSAFPGYEMLPP